MPEGFSFDLGAKLRKQARAFASLKPGLDAFACEDQGGHAGGGGGGAGGGGREGGLGASLRKRKSAFAEPTQRKKAEDIISAGAAAMESKMEQDE